MTRKVAEECMICGDNPCTCNKPAPKAVHVPKIAVPKSEPIVSKPSINPKPGVFAAMRAQASTSVMTKVVHADDVTLTEEEQFANAVRALTPILHRDEKIKYFHIIVPSEVT